MVCAKASAGAVAVGVLALSLMPAPPPAVAESPGDDLLSPDLRARVERLTAEVARDPTTLETFVERADVLWAWANAVALAGGVIPNELPLLVRVSRSADRIDAQTLSRYMKDFDFAVRELEIKDEIPDALGTLELLPDEPLVAGDWATFAQVWTVGEMPMVEGGGIYLGRDGVNDQGPLQVAERAGDNYVTVRASNPDARFVYHGPGPRQSLVTQIEGVFKLEGAMLEKGDTVTINYGDPSGGSRGFQVQSYSVSRCTFPVYLDLEGTGNFLQPEWPGVEVVGKAEVTGVAAFAPSIVKVGESFDLTVRSEDDRYNRVSGQTPEYQVLLDGTPYSTIPAGSGALTVIEGITLDTPRVYRFTVRSSDGRITGTGNPVWVREDPPYRIYWGDTHGHGAFADGQGTPDGYFSFARDDACLDFVTLSEHDLWLDDAEWRTLQEMVSRYQKDGRFIPILGFEWTVNPSGGGHHNIYFGSPRGRRVGSQVAWELRDLYAQLRRRYRPGEVLSIPHAHNPGNWEISDPDLERLVEITSTHGTFEWYGNRYLQSGWQVGFIGSSDNHHEHPGYTTTGRAFLIQRGGLAAVMARHKTSRDIFAAMRGRLAYATGGQRIILDASLNGAPMGTRIGPAGRRSLVCRAMGTAPIEAIEVVKNGGVVYRKRYLFGDVSPHTWVRVGFESTSEAFSYAQPRKYRVWGGTLEVAGARIASARALGLENRHMEHATVDGQQTVRFLVMTRGRRDGIALELEDAGPETSLTVHLEERAGNRFELAVPAIDETMGLGEGLIGRLVRDFEDNDPATGQSWVDAISLQVYDPSASLDQEFEYVDLKPPNPGDYYYLRVTQVDGEMAWSSPWWVGGGTPGP
jgi:hypothetical protein